MNPNKIQQLATPQFGTNSVYGSGTPSAAPTIGSIYTPPITPVETPTAPQETGAQIMARQANQGKAGYDIFGNPVNATVNTSSKISDIYGNYNPDPALDYYNKINSSEPIAPVDEAAIRAETMKKIQAQIDAQNAIYDQKLAEANRVGAGRLGQTNALSASAGILGSNFGSAAVDNTNSANKSIADSIQAERAAMVAALNTKGDQSVVDRIAAETTSRQNKIDSHIKNLAEAQKAKSTAASQIAKRALAAGLDLTDKNNVKEIADMYGLSPDLIASAYIDEQTVQKTAEQKDALSSAQIDAQKANAEQSRAAAEKSRYLEIGDGQMVYDLLSKTVIANNEKAAQTSGGLPNNIATQVDKLAASFDTNQITKDFVTAQNKKLSIDAIINSGVKGPGDLAIVYEFMKALDPQSVVRETEFDNAAKSGNIFQGIYARYNGYLTEGGGFLPEDVRKDFQTLTNKKYGVLQQQYGNLKSEVSRKINMKTGDTDGVDYLTNYEQAIPADTTNPTTVNPPDDAAIIDYLTKNPAATDEELKAFMQGETTAPAKGKNRAQTNNNPLNIKASAFTSTFPGVSGKDGKPALDGGNFLTFNTPEDGFNAAKKLITSNIYSDLTVDAAMKKWSNSGYDGKIWPDVKNIKVKDLTPEQLDSLINKMANQEGFYA